MLMRKRSLCRTKHFVARGRGAGGRKPDAQRSRGRNAKRAPRISEPLMLLVIWLRGQDLNLRPSGYEPDELPGCSTPRQVVEFRVVLARSWEGPNVCEKMFFTCDLQTWQRPTLPRLKTKYHRRWGVSRPCSEWERVQPPRQNHQVGKAQVCSRREQIVRSW